MDSTIPDDVRWMVREYLPTMEHVDVLLYVAKQNGEPRRLADVVTDISINAETAAARIRDLVQSRLVTAANGSAGELVYRYAPSGLKQRIAVDSLAQTYAMRPVSLIRFVYERPDRPEEAIQNFADAFRLRKPRS